MLSLRLVNLLTLSFLFFQTIGPEELADSFRKMGVPYEFCFILTTSLRYVPFMGGRIRRIIDAQRSRGIDMRPRLRNMPNFIALLIPLLIQSFVLAEQLALAMESRGFARTGRTFRKTYHISVGEYVMMIAALGLLVAFILWE
jgi:energy-coupling factor transport system permease protein